MNHALFEKYSSSQDFFYTKELNEIIEEPEKNVYTHAVAAFKEWGYYDDDTEEMRRMYQQSEFGNKIEMITEYYKFHRDVPMCFERPL